MDVYEPIKNIGSGNFGQVYLVRHKQTDEQFVIKKVKFREMSEKEQAATEQEVRLLQEMRHPNIVTYKDSFTDSENYLCIVMVYCDGGDMYSKLRSTKGKKFPEGQILDWTAQIVMTLLYLHERKILHRDLKTQNIFLNGSRLQLGDFGIAKVLDESQDLANTCIGTPYYMSPELFKSKPYSYKSDIWALGCVIYEMCNLAHAFDAQSFNGLAMKILRGEYPPLASEYSEELRQLVKQMLNTSPSARPSLRQVAEHPLVKKHIVSYLENTLSGEPIEHLEELQRQAERYGFLTIEAKIHKEEAERAQIEEELQMITEMVEDKNTGVSARDRVLKMKEQKIKEEQDRIQRQLKRIHDQNVQTRQSALQKNHEQFRTSSVFQSAFTDEDPQRALEEHADSMRESIRAKTIMIEELKESIGTFSMDITIPHESDEESDISHDGPDWNTRLKDRMHLLKQ